MSIILVVDDQPVNRQFLATLLGYFDHQIVEAGDGIEALESLREGGIELVIADVLMPGMDGYDFLQRLRADRKFGRTPVIFYTAAHYAPESRAMAQACGVEHFLSKPAEPEVILKTVNSALGRLVGGVSPATLHKFNRHVLTPPADPIDQSAIVYIVDDEHEVRQSLSAILEAEGLKTALYASAQAFLDGYDPKHPGCLVTDIYMPGMTGITLLETLRARRIHIPAIVLTGHGHTADAVDAMRLGVMEFLEKTVDRRILLTKIYRALQEDSIKRRNQAQTHAIRERMAALTIREKDLIKLLVLGKTSKEIASELRISIKTVSNHRAHVMAKTQALNLADLVRMTMITSD